MKTLILLTTGCTALQAVEFIPVSTNNYVDGVDLVHMDYDDTGEFIEEWEIGRTHIRYDIQDVTARGEWNPSEGGVDTWHIETEEWAVTLALTSSISIPFGDTYGFDLTLEKLDGSWTHTLENLGMWLMKEGPLLAFEGSVISGGLQPIGVFLEEPAPIGFTHSYFRQNTQVPFTWENGGSFDTGMDGGGWFLGQAPTTFLDVPIGDEHWAFSMNLALHEGDMFARFGLGHEISRDLVLVPEPSAWALVLAGLVALTCWRKL